MAVIWSNDTSSTYYRDSGYKKLWNGNSYDYVRDIPPEPPRHLSRAERRMRDALAREEKSKLIARLRREEASRKAMLDAKSRACDAPSTGAPPAERNLQTYDDAMAARRAARRSA